MTAKSDNPPPPPKQKRPILMMGISTCLACKEQKEILKEAGLLGKVIEYVDENDAERLPQLQKIVAEEGQVPKYVINELKCDLGTVEDTGELVLYCDDDIYIGLGKIAPKKSKEESS